MRNSKGKNGHQFEQIEVHQSFNLCGFKMMSVFLFIVVYRGLINGITIVDIMCDK